MEKENQPKEKTNENVQLHSLYGRTTKVTLGSGRVVEIREQNGDDDAVLSRMGDIQSGESLDKFIAGIVLKDHSKTPATRVTPSEVQGWRINDKYQLVMKSRIFSLGSEATVTYDWPDLKTETTYEENLEEYDVDFSKDPETQKEGKSKYAMFPYPEVEVDKDGFRHIETSSKKKVKYKFMTSHDEQYMLDKSRDDLNKNDELKSRSVHLHIEGEWRKLENFAPLSSRDMMDIRSDINKYDKVWEALSIIKHPKKDDEKVAVNVMLQQAFFFPLLT